MKLQRSTGILLGVAIALVATVTIFETRKDTQPSPGATLYDFVEADISAFTLEREDETLTFRKTDNTWNMIEPEEATADPSAIAFLLNIITSDPIQETITTTADQLPTYGLDQPIATLNLTVDEDDHRLTIGDEDFSGTSLYAMTNHNVVEPNPVEIYLIPNGIENGINRPLNEWMATEENDETANDVDNNTDEPQTEAAGENTDQNSTNESDPLPSTDNTAPEKNDQ